MTFDNELKFEEALVELLTTSCGWSKYSLPKADGTVEELKYKTEDELIQNWADILFQNNNTIDRLNGCPLTKSEMGQLVAEINRQKTPLKLNGFINGKFVTVKRDNPDDIAHLGKEVSLKIYDRDEISAGQSVYQIAEQPIFRQKNIYPSRRGDVMLLINGMPVIHIELKKSGVPISQAEGQIEKYAREGVFTGLFSLIQVFVAMNPEETVYFANPGPDGQFNPSFFFHWEDFNNQWINDYKEIATTLLHIPLAHELIGYYTVPDKSDGVLKVMRSYQIYAAQQVSDHVKKAKWDGRMLYGGYVWHTTGAGKTMTSFKSANLIANARDADKVVFVMDRNVLWTQSLNDYRNYADETLQIQETEDTNVLLSKLKSNKTTETLIVTSIQKLSNIERNSLNANDIDIISKKKVVFIIDECHRSVFGDMLNTIRKTFPRAVMFGFSGTPIEDENKKKDLTTADIFGPELCRYLISDGIRDGNVLGFDPAKVFTFSETDVRDAVARKMANLDKDEDPFGDISKALVYSEWMNPQKHPMAGRFAKDGRYIRGVEDYIPDSQYDSEKHRGAVIDYILKNFQIISHGRTFHALLATSSIPEAIRYYRMFKTKKHSLNVTALFDPSIDNDGGATAKEKEEGLKEIIQDYNKMYGMSYSLAGGDLSKFKRDISLRLAHKSPYLFLGSKGQESNRIDLLIVVDQMLTGYDSKWLNALYLDKMLKDEKIIQAFSRTNRVVRKDLKPFGVIRYFRRPNTMEAWIQRAFDIYSGKNSFGTFTQKLPERVEVMNDSFHQIRSLFNSQGIYDFSKLPSSSTEIAKFAALFRTFFYALSSAKVQGFYWGMKLYTDENGRRHRLGLEVDEPTYLTLLQRYKEIEHSGPMPESGEVPYDIDPIIAEVSTGLIDDMWLNARFTKYVRALETGEPVEALKADISNAFAGLSKEDQEFANTILHDVEQGILKIDPSRTLKDYITEYKAKAKDDQIHRFAVALGIPEDDLRSLMKLHLNAANLDQYGRLTALKEKIVWKDAKSYLEKKAGGPIKSFRLTQKVNKLLEEFIVSGGFDIEDKFI